MTAASSSYFERLLVDHVVRPWFPRCIDRDHGGFLLDFDRRWRPSGKNEKLLESQARQTLLAAELFQVYPDNRDLSDAVSAGFHFLKDTMWDHANGGWFWKVDRTGVPIAPQTKHLHGMIYGLQACIAVHAATGEDAALALARTAFAWIDGHLHDEEHGGYIQVMTREGRPIHAAADYGAKADHLGSPVGLKDGNVQFDFLEALTYVLRHIRHDLARQRHRELISITLDRVVQEGRPLYFQYHRDWRPASTLQRPMHSFQLASRLIEARDLNEAPEKLVAAALRIVAECLEYGWSEPFGGFVFDHDAGREPNETARRNIQWWGSIEAYKALFLCHEIAPDFAPAAFRTTVLSRFIENFCDRRHGGFYRQSAKTLGWSDRIFPTARRRLTLAKGGMWKDASHEGRALLRLSGLFRPAPAVSRQILATTETKY